MRAEVIKLGGAYPLGTILTGLEAVKEIREGRAIPVVQTPKLETR